MHHPIYEPPFDQPLKSLQMFDTDPKEDLLKFVQWLNNQNAVHVGTDIWKIENDHINDEKLIEKYLKNE